MHPFLEYLIKANGLLLFFWLFYRLFLQKETFYTTNRWYLLGSIALSIIAPLIIFTKTVFIEAPKPTIDWNQLAVIHSQNTIVEENLFTIENSIIATIALISVILVLKTLFQLAQTYHKIKKLPYDVSLQVRRSSDDTIFSLYPYIVVPNHFEEIPNSEMIIAHEKIHIQQKHSFDMIVMQLIRSVFWMNPLLHYFQKDIEVNLEYIVDEHLQTQFDSKTYQLSLLSFHSTTPQPFVNSFNSQLKKRILQINAKKSNPMKKMKMILATPAIVAFFTMFQIETKAQIVKKENVSVEQTKNSVLFLIDGKKVSQEEVNQLSPDVIGSINVTKDEEAIQKYGDEAINGVIEISTTKTNSKTTTHTFNGQYVHIVDGKVVTAETFSKANNNKDKELTIVQNSNYAKELGHEGKDGVFILTSKVDSALVKFIDEVKSNDNQTFVVNGKKVSHEEASIFLKNNKNAKTTILNDVIVIESNEIKQAQSNKPLYIVNGKEISETHFRTIQPNDIESINVLKDKKAIDKYGEKGKEGVLEIQLKDKPKMDIKVSVQLEKNSDNISEDFALFETIFDSAKSAKTYESNDVKISSIEATLTTDKNKFAKKVTY